MIKTRKIVCKVCGAVFETALPNQKYCSSDCKEDGRRQNKRDFAAAHPGYQAAYMRQYRARKKRQANGHA